MAVAKEAFIEFLARSEAIKFGEFTLKSGRESPFFINMGAICAGAESYELGKFFAQKIHEAYGNNFEVIFGPAYKGIPMAVAASIAYNKEFGVNKPWLFDRKEMKRHGEVSGFVGASIDLKSRAIILDDVLTTGETKLEAIKKLQGLGAKVEGIVIAVDRQERGTRLSALEEFSEKTGIPVHSIVTIKEVFDYLKGRHISSPGKQGHVYVTEKDYAKFMEYRGKYGV